MTPRPDALAKLLEYVDVYLDACCMSYDTANWPSYKAARAKTRLLVNELLRERAHEAVMETAELKTAGIPFDDLRVRIRAAVLRRPTGRARGRAGR